MKRDNYLKPIACDTEWETAQLQEQLHMLTMMSVPAVLLVMETL